MNSLSEFFTNVVSDFARPSILLQLVTLGLTIFSWLLLTKLLNLDNRRWPFEKRFKYITTFKKLANGLLLMLMLRGFGLALDHIANVAGLVFFLTDFYGLLLLSRFFIIILMFYAPIAIVRRFDIYVLRPSYLLFGFSSFLSQIYDLPSLLAMPAVVIGGDSISFNDICLIIFGSYFLATGSRSLLRIEQLSSSPQTTLNLPRSQ